MSNTLQTLIHSAQQLTPIEQIELINAVSQLLHQHYQQVPVPQNDAKQNDFWDPKSIEDIVANQQTKAITDLASLKVDFCLRTNPPIAYLNLSNNDKRIVSVNHEHHSP
ncbi:MAG: hypothetical protein F6K65_39690 [Moorea sp. SIO3C2]|nr:hypothetical protein [Moorena sp. SIO3C2]